ncbi:MAG: extensin family protein [Pseudolabrys sp.]|nr:extensin family protein [Pseudolabrys sp.]
MRRLPAIATLAAATLFCGAAAADVVPLPHPRPPMPFEPKSFAEAAAGITLPDVITSEPSPCRLRLETAAVIEPLPHLIGPDACGGGDMVRLKAFHALDRKDVVIVPPPELRCEMAEAVVVWLRDDIAPIFSAPALIEVENFDSYECRGRNRVFGAKLSEHGKGNALDIRAFKLADGKRIEPTDVYVDHEQRDKFRQAACNRFTTVLGPGSDGHHESHIHLDLAERRNGHRMCQWEVRDPMKELAQIPLPQPRPNFGAESPAANDKRKL